jgi:putative MATE family efflux protein
MNHSKKGESALTKGSLVKNIFLYTLPIMATGILQLLFNAADMIVVGKYAGDVALAAIGSTGALINLIVNLLIGLSVGASVSVAQRYGAGDEKGVSRTVHTAICVSVIGGILAGCVGFFGAYTFLGWMGSPDDVIGMATLYLQIYFCGVPFMMVYNFGTAILRSIGDTQRPLLFLAASGLVNVVLNLFFVLVFHMDVDGVAWATVLSQGLAAALVVFYLTRVNGCFALSFSKLRIHYAELKMIARIGIPAGIQGSVFSLSNVVIQSSINSFGSVVMAGNSAASSIEGFVYVAMNAYQQAALTFVGQNLGAGNYDRLKKVLRHCLWMVTATGLSLIAIVLLFARPLLRIYCTEGSAAIEYGVIRFGIVCSTYFLCGIMDSLTGCIRGLGTSFSPMIISLLGACGLRIIWIYTVFQKYHTLRVLYACYPVSWLITALALLICYWIVYNRTVGRKIKAARSSSLPSDTSC